MAFIKLYDIDEYIADNALNSRIYTVLLDLQDNNKNNRIPLKRKPIEIFNQAYYICDKLISEKHPENEIQSLWNKTLENFLEFETSIVFSCVYVILSFTETKNLNISYCLPRIKNFVSENYFVEFSPILSEDVHLISSLPKDFQQLKQQADIINNPNEKILFYSDVLTRFKQSRNKENIIQQISDEIELIKKTQELSIQPTEPIEKSNVTTHRCLKVTTDTLLILLKKANILQNADNTKIANLISYLTGFSAETIRKRLSNTDELTSRHKEEVEYINNILKALNIDETIKYNKQR